MSGVEAEWYRGKRTDLSQFMRIPEKFLHLLNIDRAVWREVDASAR